MTNRRRAKKVVAVDWDPRTLRIVHAVLTKRGVRIDRLLSVAIPPGLDPDNPQAMGRHIRRTLDQERIGTRDAIVDVPRDQVILKTLKLPVSQPEELPGMVEIQIAKELPFPASEATIDFALGRRQEDEPTGDVLVAAIRCELLDQYRETFAAAGLRLDRVGLRPFANKVAVCELLRHGLPERVLFIDVRPTFMEIDILHEGALAFSRSASVTIPDSLIGGSASSSREADGLRVVSPLASGGEPGGVRGGAGPVVDALVLEVTRSLEAYRAGDAGGKIDHVVVGGDVGVEEALAEALQKRLGVTTELYNPASTFGWEPDEGAGASAFAASLGLVLSHAAQDEAHFDFLHPKKTESIARKRLKKAPMVAAVVVVFLAAGGIGFAQYTKPGRERLAKLEHRIRVLQRKEKDFNKFLKLYEQVASFERSQVVWVDVLYDVFSLLPPNTEMLVTHLETNQRDRRLTLKTRSKHRQTPTDLVLKLEAFRREGATKPRFRARVGPQVENDKEKYPFAQDIRIWVLNDGVAEAGERAVGKSG